MAQVVSRGRGRPAGPPPRPSPTAHTTSSSGPLLDFTVVDPNVDEETDTQKVLELSS